MLTLTIQDVFYAAILAFFLTWVILSLIKIFRVVTTRTSEFDYRPGDMSRVLEKCYALFPRDIVQFQGKTYTRGMMVRVTTDQNRSITGQLVGLNNENILCLVTNRYIVAQEMEKIDSIALEE